MIHRQQVHDALMKVDDNILKLDTIDPEYIKKVDHPNGTYDVNQIIERMKAFNGHIIIQTMFMRGSVQCSMVNGQCSMESVDNTGEEYVGPWLEAIKQIKPHANCRAGFAAVNKVIFAAFFRHFLPFVLADSRAFGRKAVKPFQARNA